MSIKLFFFFAIFNINVFAGKYGPDDQSPESPESPINLSSQLSFSTPSKQIGESTPESNGPDDQSPESPESPKTPINLSSQLSFSTPSKQIGESTPESTSKLNMRKQWNYGAIPQRITDFFKQQWICYKDQIIDFFLKEHEKKIKECSEKQRLFDEKIEKLNQELAQIMQSVVSSSKEEDIERLRLLRKRLKKEDKLERVRRHKTKNQTATETTPVEISNPNPKKDEISLRTEIAYFEKQKALCNVDIDFKPEEITDEYYLNHLLSDPAHISKKEHRLRDSFISHPARHDIESNAIQELFAVMRALEQKKIIGPVVRGPAKIDFYDLSNGDPIDVKMHVNNSAKIETVEEFVDRVVFGQVLKQHNNYFTNKDVYVKVVLDVGVTSGNNYCLITQSINNLLSTYPDPALLKKCLILVNPEGN